MVQFTVGAEKSETIIGRLKSNLKTALLQFGLLFVEDTAPGFGYIGKSLLPPQPAQTD